jgi:hypothetical protein
MISVESPTAYIAHNKVDSSKSIDVNKFHEMMGHCGLNCLRKTAQVHGLNLKGDFKVCKDCAVAKARQKNLNKDWKGGSQVPGERVYLDMSSIRDESYGGSRFWVLLVDDYTDYCWSILLKHKSDLKSKEICCYCVLEISLTFRSICFSVLRISDRDTED